MTPQEWIEESKDKLLSELKEFLTFPSISVQPAHRGDLRKAAEWLQQKLVSLGFRVEMLGDPPVVHGFYQGPSGSPTALFYGHYDVQPPEPLEEWESPPFEPKVTEKAIYARGASDDKGQVFMHLAAWRFYVERRGGIPLSLHVVIEGEEETGSKVLSEILQREGARWRSDVVIVSDTAFFDEDIPTLTVGLRGLLYTEIRVRGPKRDLHSGSLGGIVENPAIALAYILANLKGPDGRVKIPGFYESVRPPSAEEVAAWRQLPANETYYLGITGAPALAGEVGFSPIERVSIRPTLDVNGMWSGYTGPGSKTIIPAEAGAKVSMRLVPEQEPMKIWEAYKDFILSLAPAGVEVSVSQLHEPTPAFETSTNSPFYKAAEEAIARTFGKRPIPLREGGSIPILNAFRQALGGVPVILMGFGLLSDKVHSPNEHFRLSQLWRGIEALIQWYSLVSKPSSLLAE
ncbi:MAG: dipeptidase [Bacteroidia bacterium]|nr:dipeptidase [Bacteroidia bacterium]MDW8135083.1 dipeptidase [Bacteroidia bacterium]